MRSLLTALVQLPWQSREAHPALEALKWLRDLYAHQQRSLPADVRLALGSVWRTALADTDRERAFRALEVATLLNLRRALRNGTLWIDHSLAFRSREQLFIPTERYADPSSRALPPARFADRRGRISRAAGRAGAGRIGGRGRSR